MYIEPLALFIIGEVVVVFIIISVILFRRSRLLRIMLSLLTERRLNRLRLESEEHKELLALRKDYGKLQAELLQMRREGGKTYAEQVQNRLDDLANATPEQAEDDLPESPDEEDIEADPEGTHRTRAIRRAFYEFEAARAAPLEHDIIEAEETLLEQLKIQLGRDPDEEESELGQTQNAQLLQRVRELEAVAKEHQALQKAFQAKEEKLAERERQIEELKRIDDASRLDPGNRPAGGSSAQDEIYRLKCERFDMAESINNLKLRLQKLVDDGDTNELLKVQAEQIEAQARYIADAEENIRLLEEELESLGSSGATDNKAEMSTEQVERLAGYADEQKASMADIRENLRALRATEKAEEKERLLEEQEAQLHRMERSVQEAETCVTIMESELAQANERINSLNTELQNAEGNDRYKRQVADLEKTLQTFVTDAEDMMICITSLEKHNQVMRKMLIEQGVTEQDIPPPDPPSTPQSR